MKKYNIIDLFSGCGGLLDGFMQSGMVNHLASVEWELAPVLTSRKRMREKWGEDDSDETVIHFDIQRINELLNGFNDEKYGKSIGLKNITRGKDVNFIIGGPPCQAYSVAGRVSVDQTEKADYRNFLFEYYMKIVEELQPNIFVFENVPGMLSAMPDGTPIIKLIKRDIEAKGYEIIEDIRKYAIIDASEYSVPQSRKRVILIGINKRKNDGKDIQSILKTFYQEILPRYKGKKKISVEEAIGDLPKIYPLWTDKRPSHTVPECDKTWHYSRFNSIRDVKIFKMLAEDIESGKNEYTDSEKLKEIYNKATGSNTNVHKYHVLRKDEPSTTILAHLHKDGLRFIHYDSVQSRTITVREAARLQTFDDDFDFIGSQGAAYKMIGNAVPCKLALVICKAIIDLVKEMK